MTCVVGLIDNGSVWMGADSCSSDNWGQGVVKNPKVWKKNGFIIGMSGSFATMGAARYRFMPPNPERMELLRYMSTVFVDELQAHGVDFVENDNMMVGIDGRLFVMESNYQVLEYKEGFCAIGSGYHVALGSMYSTDLPPRQRISTALKAAEKYASGVCKPFKILSIGKQHEKMD